MVVDLPVWSLIRLAMFPVISLGDSQLVRLCFE